MTWSDEFIFNVDASQLCKVVAIKSIWTHISHSTKTYTKKKQQQNLSLKSRYIRRDVWSSMFTCPGIRSLQVILSLHNRMTKSQHNHLKTNKFWRLHKVHEHVLLDTFKHCLICTFASNNAQWIQTFSSFVCTWVVNHLYYLQMNVIIYAQLQCQRWSYYFSCLFQHVFRMLLMLPRWCENDKVHKCTKYFSHVQVV